MVSTKIHPTAIVDPHARIAAGVEIGPYCLVGPQVAIGRDTRLAGHVTIQGNTQIGERCQIFSYACLGGEAQVRQPSSRSSLRVGDDNLIREYVTMNVAMNEDAATIIGNKNFLMTNVHIAHDCVVGNHNTIANAVALGGHVHVGDHATIGGLSGIHQFVRVGSYAMIGGLSKVVVDVPPFSTCDGNPASFYGLNAIGLKRAGFSPLDRQIIRRVLKTLLASGKALPSAIQEIETEYASDAHVKEILQFVRSSKRGLVRAKSFVRNDLETHVAE